MGKGKKEFAENKILKAKLCLGYCSGMRFVPLGGSGGQVCSHVCGESQFQPFGWLLIHVSVGVQLFLADAEMKIKMFFSV